MDVDGQVLATYSDVTLPVHLSIDSEGRVLVADWRNDHILLLSRQLGLERVIDKTNSQGKWWWPLRLSYNELMSRLYVAHSSSESSSLSLSLSSDVISLFNVD